jgi:hypothetical protein
MVSGQAHVFVIVYLEIMSALEIENHYAIGMWQFLHLM